MALATSTDLQNAHTALNQGNSLAAVVSVVPAQSPRLTVIIATGNPGPQPQVTIFPTDAEFAQIISRCQIASQRHLSSVVATLTAAGISIPPNIAAAQSSVITPV